MAGNLSAEEISMDDFRDVLNRYSKHVKADLKDLDEYRFEELPKEIEERWEMRIDDEELPILLISKGELVQLVTWKLKHGTFRPKLQSLVESNDEKVVNKLMQDLSLSNGSAKEKMKMLTQLKGVGPATASLVLSSISPITYPFFSDELFRWIHWDGKNADGTDNGIKSGKGWARPIGYTPKEYDSLIARCEAVQGRLSKGKKLSFLDLEKVAYVLGKEQTDVDAQAPAGSAKSTAKRKINDVDTSELTSTLKRRKEKKTIPSNGSGRKTKSKR
jgi:hypothetical protein